MAVDAIHEDYKDPEGLRRFLFSRNTERCGKCTAEAVRRLFAWYNENIYMDAMLRRITGVRKTSQDTKHAFIYLRKPGSTLEYDEVLLSNERSCVLPRHDKVLANDFQIIGAALAVHTI